MIPRWRFERTLVTTRDRLPRLHTRMQGRWCTAYGARQFVQTITAAGTPREVGYGHCYGHSYFAGRMRSLMAGR
jgi:hypothetical protein